MRPMDLAGVMKPNRGGVSSSAFFDDADHRGGQEIRQVGGYTDRTAAGSAAAVRHRKGLVQVEVHQVETDVGRAHDAEQGVEVCPVPVHQAAAIMDELDDLLDDVRRTCRAYSDWSASCRARCRRRRL